jgi:parallel beta-helix repeat protein
MIIVGLLTFGVLASLGSAIEVRFAENKVQLSPWTIAYTPHAPIRINSDAEFTAQFSNRTIWGLEINGAGKGFCIFIGNCSQMFTVKDCRLYNANGKPTDPYFHDSGLYLHNSSNGTLVDNTCIGNSNNGITLEDSANNTIINNTCNGNYYSIYLTGSKYNIVIYNNCNGNLFCGIYLTNSDANILSNNNCSGNAVGGISLVFSNANTIEGNNCSGNPWNGINLGNSNINFIISNNCSENRWGIVLGNSNSNHLTDNLCSDNSEYGTTLETRSKNNRIYHNNFINNNAGKKQANDTTGSNFWNTTTEGNYWSDWTGPDNDTDGIVDFPYHLNGGKNATDFFPLTKIVVIQEFPPSNLIAFLFIIISMVFARKWRYS